MNFVEASKAVANLSKRPGNDILLQLYGLFKQGSTGDVQGSRPGLLDIKGRAKFDAWKKLSGMGKDEAQRKYVELVERLIAQD